MHASSPGSNAVAYLGPEGTFAHAVAQNRFGTQATLIPCASIEAVFDQVLANAAGSGIVPLENSSGGWIYDTVDLLIQNAPRINIRQELTLDVKLALVGRSGQPIKSVYSHFAPLKHNANWLAAHYPQARAVPCASTARAAQMAKEDPQGAALTSRQAGAIYGLEVLEYPIDPNEVNVTSFVEITRSGKNSELGQKLGLVIRIKNEPSSLVNLLLPFAQAKMNLTRIISRPIQGEPSAYHFLLEVEVREDDSRLEGVLAEAKKHTNSLVSLGNYAVKSRIQA